MPQSASLVGTGEFFQRDNYAPVTDELTEFNLPVEGAIPAELDGWYLRNGPNPRQATAHWFTGDGMIHGVRIEGGRAAWYRNRWVRTDSFSEDFPRYNADGTRNLRFSVANTHVVNHAGKTLALIESSLPYEISNELETLGAYDFGGKLVDSMTAHPRICPTTGELHFFGYGSIFEPYVTHHRADANGELTINRPLDVKGHTMMHDFALTAEHVVFMDLPLVFNLDVAIKGEGDMPYRWSDEYGARLGMMRRADPFGPVRWFDIDPCYVFHVANAFGTTSASGTSIVVHAVEFPRIDDRLATLPARYAVSVGDGRLVRYDLTTGDAVEHAFGTAQSPGGPGEAVFVPGSGSADESNGWYIGYVYDPARDGSDLVIIDASDFAAQPVARIKLPHRVPYGFHGNWIAG
jgi:carotenoid cleavage dioxygenase-like enzyme